MYEIESDISEIVEDYWEESAKVAGGDIEDYLEESVKDASGDLKDYWEESVKDASGDLDVFWEEKEELNDIIGDFRNELVEDYSGIVEFRDGTEEDPSEIVEQFSEKTEEDYSEIMSSEKDTCNIEESLAEDELDKDISDIEDFSGETDIDNANKIMKRIWPDLEKDTRRTRKNIPNLIAIRKKKLLIAVKEMPDENLSEEEKEFVKSFRSQTFFMQSIIKMFKPQSKIWDDSIATDKVYEILLKHAEFELSKYLECVKLVFLAYSGKINDTETVNAMEYVLTHARLFGDTTKTTFHLNKIEQELEVMSDDDSEKQDLPSLPTNKLMNKISQLIHDLTTTYNETKYIILNVNTTYFTLLMLRRIVKNEAEFSKAFRNIQTHDNYVRLCPMPLDNQLPKCEFKICAQHLVKCAYLAIEAYLNTEDERTKRVLRATCILNMEWNGLQLPHFFFKVVNLFKVKTEELYDFLFDGDSEYSILETCFNLADDYYNSYEKLKTGATNRWFPYCRVLDGAYHMNLSAKENVQICIILAYLVDMKIGFDKSTIRMSHWVKSHFRDRCVQTANALYTKLNKNA